VAAKKATQSTKTKEKATPPVRLGTKRSCIKCGAKFYDFEKEVIVCPKCNAKMTADDFTAVLTKTPEPKKAKPEKTPPEAALEGDEAPAAGDDAFESTDDLGGEEDVVEEIEVDDDDEEEGNY
jgi:hypothetical protein